MTLRLLALPLIAMATGSAILMQPNSEKRTEESASQPTSATKDAQADREAAFIQRMSGVVLRGAFQMTNADGLGGKAPMTKPSVERYEIANVQKLGGDNWLVTARIQYADRDVQVPVPVHVHWAAGTPIITLDKMRIPMIGEYSARVIIDDGFYAGTWRGPTYGGVLSGQILKPADVDKVEKMEAAGWTMTMPSHGVEKDKASKE